MPAPISFGAAGYPAAKAPPSLLSFIRRDPGGTKFRVARLELQGGGIALLERARKGELLVLAIAALMLAAASPAPAPALTMTAPWWEKFTFTMTDDGTQQACQYATSLPNAGAPGCDDSSGDASSASVQTASMSGGSYTKITIERRFTPATRPVDVKLQTGDTLLGEQVLALAIDHQGAVLGCEVIDKSGEMRPPYGCSEVRTEKFEASAGSTPQLRHGYMTVLVYGHEEYPV